MVQFPAGKSLYTADWLGVLSKQKKVTIWRWRRWLVSVVKITRIPTGWYKYSGAEYDRPEWKYIRNYISC